MINFFEDCDLSFDAEGIFAGVDFGLVEDFDGHCSASGQMDGSSNFAEGAATDCASETEGFYFLHGKWRLL
jgi:hypothetical protein